MTEHEAQHLEFPDVPGAEHELANGPAPEPLVEQTAHWEVDPEPALLPPAPNFRRSRLATASLVGTVICAGTLMTATAHQDPRFVLAAAPEPGETASLPDPFAAGWVPELMGPPKPTVTAVAPSAVASGAAEMAAAATGLPGGIGYLGPIDGALNTSLTGGYVRGPLWEGAPLPGAGRFGFLTENPIIPGVAPTPGPSVAPVGSELPDLNKLALARLANPLLSGPGPVSEKPAPNEVSAEKPLSVSLSVARPARGYEPGATVAVRGTTSVDAYFVLIGVDAEGRASTLFRSAGAARSFGYAIRAQVNPGPQYLVAVAAASPLTGADVAAAMRASGQGFVAPVMTIAAEGAQPGAAWSAAVAQAGTLGGAAKGWKRHEWAVAATSFFTRPPDKVAVQKPAAEKPVGVKPEPVKPQETEGSVLPGAAKPEPAKSDKSAIPAVKPESAQPKSPMALPEPAKPVTKPAGAAAEAPK